MKFISDLKLELELMGLNIWINIYLSINPRHSSIRLFRIEKNIVKSYRLSFAPLSNNRFVDDDNAINWRVQQAEKPTDLYAVRGLKISKKKKKGKGKNRETARKRNTARI